MVVPDLFFLIAVFIFGTIIGSFLNVVIWRLPRKKTLGSLNGRSECPHCHHVLGATELVPLFSFLFSGGRCRHCKKPISWRYPIIETVTGILFVLMAWQLHPNVMDLLQLVIFVKALLVIAFLVVIFVIDLEHYLILDKIIFPGLVLFSLFNLGIDSLTGNFGWHSLFVSGVIGALGAGIAFFAVWFLSQGRWMGFGDVKYVLLLGIIFGYTGVAMLLLLAFWMGFVVGVLLMVAKRATMNSRLPFGTFLSAAGVVMLLFGPAIISWYLHLIGFYTA